MPDSVSSLEASMVIIVLAAFLVSLAATGALTRAEGWLRIMDRPNERSLHTRPTPRTGGLAICLASITALTLAAIIGWGARAELAWIAGAALIIGVVSFIDDRTPLPARTRLVAQLAGAGLIAGGGLVPETIAWPGGGLTPGAWLGGALWVVFLVWMINLYNFMDGMDGLAGGMAVFGFGTLGVLGLLAGDPGYAGICWVIAASAAGFLVWNFPPARIFMGDTGSSTLGLMAAALSLWAGARDLFPLWIAVLVFFPFIFDSTVTLLRRSLEGKRVWEAHRTHYYQRLVQTGWTHRRTTLWEYAAMAVCAAGAVSALRAPVTVQVLIIAVIIALHVGAAVAVNIIERKRGGSLTEKSVR